MNRRDLLRLFGVGATIVPVANTGAIIQQATATIIEPPKVELAQPDEIGKSLAGKRAVLLRGNVIFEDGSLHSFGTESFLYSRTPDVIDIRVFLSKNRPPGWTLPQTHFTPTPEQRGRLR